jgi:hypothetical protein
LSIGENVVWIGARAFEDTPLGSAHSVAGQGGLEDVELIRLEPHLDESSGDTNRANPSVLFLQGDKTPHGCTAGLMERQ